MLILIAILLLTIFAYKYAKSSYHYRGLPPPAPYYVPILGHLPYVIYTVMTKEKDYFTKVVIESAETGVRPILTLYFAGYVTVQVNDFELIKEFTSKQGELFSGRPRSVFNDYLALGSNSRGIINTNGIIWKTNRRFSLTWLRNFGFGKNVMEQRIRAQVDRLIDCLADECQNANATAPAVVDLEIPLKFTISSIIAQVAFGKEYDKDDETYLTLEKALNDQFAFFAKPIVFLLFAAPWLRYVPLFGHFGYDFISNSTKILLDYLKYELEDVRKEFVVGSEPSNIVEAYLTEISENKEIDASVFNDDQLIGVVADLWAAGMETTATTCLWCFLYMIHFPQVQEKVYAEIISACGTERQPNMLDSKDMPYTMATLNEVHRIGSLFPNGVAHAPVTDATLGGYRVPAHTGVMSANMLLSYDPKVFPEPTKFKPERHVDSDGKTLIKYETLIPFGLGKRSCLGEGMARTELFLIFTSIIQRFRVASVPNEEAPTLKFRMRGTISPYPYRAALYPRE